MKANHVVSDLSLQRGMAAENRLVEITRSLRHEIPWIGKVRLAGFKHDRVGVDVFISINPQEGARNIKVPIQVKSSFQGLLSHQAKYALSTKAATIIVVVNNRHSDDDIKDYLKLRLAELRLRESLKS